MNKICIYDKATLNIIAEPFIKNPEAFNKEPTKFFPNWDSETMIYTYENLKYPKIVDGILVEKTDEELKLEGIIPLVDGEYILDDNLIIVPYTDDFYKPIWVTPNWVEDATDEEILDNLKSEIISVSTELSKLEVSGFNDLELQSEKEKLIEKHKELALKIALK